MSLALTGTSTARGSTAVNGAAVQVGDTASCVGAATFKVEKLTIGAAGGPFTFGSYGNVTNDRGAVVTPDSITTTAQNVVTPSPQTHIVTRLNTAVTLTESWPTDWTLVSAQCRDTNGAVSGNGSTTVAAVVNPTTGQITVPPAFVRASAAIVCTVTNELAAPVLSVAKALTAVIIDGVREEIVPGDPPFPVEPGWQLEYTVTVTNTGTAPGSAYLTETVPVGTRYTGIVGAWSGCVPSPPTPAGTSCTHVAEAAPGDSVSVQFVVTIDDPAAASLTEVRNVVAAVDLGGTDLCVPAEACVVVRPVPPAWTMSKVASLGGVDLADGDVVRPGDVVTYTVTATAVRGVTTGIVLRDFLGDVLDDATFVGTTATLVVAGGAPQAVTPTGVSPNLTLTTPSFDLSALPVSHEVATLTYSITVHESAWSSTLLNSAEGAGSVNPDRCVATPVAGDSECLTRLVTPAYLLLMKVGQGINGVVNLDGAAFALFADDGGDLGPELTEPGVVAGGATGRFSIAGLAAGTYWLRETVAPAGHNLLAQDVRFVVAIDYDADPVVTTVTLAAGNPQVTAATDAGGTATIRVEDTTPVALPLSGGPGTGGITFIGTSLVAGAAALLLLRSIRARRRGVTGRT